mmetsp:Transcript_10100/g.38284  ORF Transcript_10100/g.38284 Transcript_10100/m.38284 type:complete len:247 (+) Transcript_10100:1639-2379(+)
MKRVILEELSDFGHLQVDDVRKHELIGVRPNHALCVVVRGQHVFHYASQEPEGLFLLGEEQEGARDEIERLAVSNVGIVGGEGEKDAPQGLAALRLAILKPPVLRKGAINVFPHFIQHLRWQLVNAANQKVVVSPRRLPSRLIRPAQSCPDRRSIRHGNPAPNQGFQLGAFLPRPVAEIGKSANAHDVLPPRFVARLHRLPRGAQMLRFVQQVSKVSGEAERIAASASLCEVNPGKIRLHRHVRDP